jgi:hypothetical protein
VLSVGLLAMLYIAIEHEGIRVYYMPEHSNEIGKPRHVGGLEKNEMEATVCVGECNKVAVPAKDFALHHGFIEFVEVLFI